MAFLDELLIALGYDYEDKEVKKFTEDLNKTIDRSKQLIKWVTAGAVAINGMVVASAVASDNQGKLANEIGITVEKLSELQYAQQIAGGSAEGMGSSLQNLAIRAAEAARGVGSGIEAFGLLGISVTDINGKLKPTNQLLLEVSRKFQGLDKARQIELADKLGLRDSIRLLQLGPKEIQRLSNEAEALGVTTGKDAAIAADFNDSLVRLWTIIKLVSRTITRVLAPVMRDVTERFIEWWKVNKDLIESKLPEFIDKSARAFKILALAAGVFVASQVLGQVTSLIGLMNKLTLATLATNAAALIIPTLIGAAILALGLLAEDAKVFFEGGDSFIGEMIEKYPKWETMLRSVASVFATLWDLTSMIFEGWGKIFNLFSSTTLDDFKGFLKNIPGFLGEVGAKGDVATRGFLSDVGSNVSGAVSNFIDKLEISIPGVGDAEATAQAIFNIFQQSSQDLTTAVDQ